MQIPRLYTAKNLVEGERISLDEQKSQHLLRVLRARIGDSVIVFDGKQGEYSGTLIEANKSNAVIKLIQYQNVDRESPLAIHLLQGISRGERMDYVIQKASELGVAFITPLFTARCTVKLSGERLAKRVAHWQSIAISACEQSGRCHLPKITPAITLKNCMRQHQGNGFICDTAAEHSIHDYPKLNGSVSVLIGPEGGFTKDEIQLAKDAGFQSLSLGPRILRTETATVVAATLLQMQSGDF